MQMRIDLQSFGNDSYYFVVALNSGKLIYRNRDFAEYFGIKESEFNNRLLLKVINHNNVASSESVLNSIIFTLGGKSVNCYLDRFKKVFENDLILLKLCDS